MSKKKILLISDNLLATSGVGVQSRYLAVGLAATGKYTIRQLGAAIKHEHYNVTNATPDIIVKPIDGFGDKTLYRQVLATERPDVVVIFTDPRFFGNLFEVHDEFQQVCPIVYNHLWDQCELPPIYNKNMYDCVDTFMCINRPTHDFLKPLYGDRVLWAPHALPKEIFHPMSELERRSKRSMVIKGRDDHFVISWCGRNAHRKRPGDLVWAFRMFLDKLQSERGHTKATLLMHTDPHDQEGPNLIHIVDTMKLHDNVVFSRDILSFDDMRVLHNVSDCAINISFAEGFGLPILEAMYCAKPIIAVKTGGLTRQVVDYRDGSENGIAVEPAVKKLVGSQTTPYIIEDVASVPDVAEAMWKMYEIGPEKRAELGQKAMRYAHEEFGMERLINTWDEALEMTLRDWKTWRKPWKKTVVR